MNRALSLVRFAPGVLIAALYLGLWVGAEVGRGVQGFATMLMFAVAIAVARWSWLGAMALCAVALALGLVGAVPDLGATEWPAYAGIAFATGLVWSGRDRAVSWRATGVGAFLVVAAVGLMLLSGWMSWTNGSVLAVWGFGINAGVLVALALAALGVSCVIGWALGLIERELLEDRWQLTATVAAQRAQLDLAAERNRIAQEMHDVVAHSLAVIVAQADGARYLETARPAAMASALESIAGAARTALVDVRGMIDGIVDGVEPPQPTLDGLPDLVDSVRDAGLDVVLTEAGERGALGPAQQAAVYRIVQEGLTNALRHRGRGSRADVVLDWRGPGLSVQLVSGGEGERSAEPTSGGGRGIPGMAERARLAGGWLAAGVDDSGDHRTTAFIPYRSASVPAEVAA